MRPRARSGSSPLRQTARAPLGQVTRRLEGSNRGRHHGGATAKSPDGPSTITSRISAAVGAIRQPSFMVPFWARCWIQQAPARVLPAPRPATYAQTRHGRLIIDRGVAQNLIGSFCPNWS